MKSILFIHQGTGIGGASLCLNELLNEIKTEYDITVLCIYQSDAVDYFRSNGFKTDVLDSFFYRKIYKYFYHSEASYYTLLTPIAFSRAVISYIINLYLAKEIIKKYNPSLIHLNSSVLTDWAIVAKKNGYKVVIHVREPISKGYFGIRIQLIRFVIKKYTDHVVAISYDNANRLGLLFKTTIIYDTIRNLPFEIKNKTDQNISYFTYFGGSMAIKGFHVLAQALKYLDPDIRIYFGGYFYKNNVGVGLIWKFKHLIKQIIPIYIKWFSDIKIVEKSEKIIEIGVVDNVYEYISKSRALLFPSTKPHFSIPVLEAYKIGIPVIVSDVEGMNEIVDNNTGIFFKKNNSKSLANAINYMAKMDNNQYDKYSANCLRKLEEINDNNKNNKIKDVFKRLLK